MAYSAYVLTNESRNKLLQRKVPEFPDVIAHHITHKFPDDETPPPARARIIAYAADDKVEAFVVEINGSTERPDGSVYHLTYSIDRNAGAKPVHSNRMLKTTKWSKFGPVDLDVESKLLK